MAEDNMAETSDEPVSGTIEDTVFVDDETIIATIVNSEGVWYETYKFEQAERE